MIINFRDRDDREIIINMDNVTCIKYEYISGGHMNYVMYFVNGSSIELDYKEHDKFIKALGEHGE